MAVMNLNNLPNLLQRRNAFAHNWHFTRAIIDLFDQNRGGGTRVNDTFVIPNRGEGPPFVKHGPILIDHGNNFYHIDRQEVVDQKFGVDLVSMKGFIKLVIEPGIVDIEGRLGMFLLTKDGTAINIVQEVIKLFRLVRESTIIVEEVLQFTMTFQLGGDTDWGFDALDIH
jgi:hypothetical protein